MLHAVRWILMAVSITVGVGTVQAANHREGANVTMDIQQGLVTASLYDVSVREALQYIADNSGVEFRVDEKVAGKVTISVASMNVSSFVRHVLKPYNYAMVYDDGKKLKLLRVDVLNSGSSSLVGRYETIHAHASALRNDDHHGSANGRHELATSRMHSRQYDGQGGSRLSFNISNGNRFHHSAKSSLYRSHASINAVTRNRVRLAQLHHAQQAIRHRMVAEVAAIHGEQSRLEAQMRISSPIQQLMLVKQLNVLSSQEIRSKQKNSQRLLHIQKMIKNGLARMPHLLTVKQVAGQNRANMIRQHDYALQKRLMVRR